jgi:hypothetical protein
MWNGSITSMPGGGQWASGLVGDALGNSDAPKKSPEEGGEEHHLRRDEQRHAVTQTDLHHRRVGFFNHRLLDDVAPPAEHHAQDRQNAQDQQQLARPMHIQDHAGRQQPAREGAQQRPWAGIDQVVRMRNTGPNRGGWFLRLVPVGDVGHRLSTPMVQFVAVALGAAF